MQISNKVQGIDNLELENRLGKEERIELVGYVGKPTDTVDVSHYIYLGFASSLEQLKHETVRAEKCIKVDGVKIIGYGMYVEGEKDAEV